MKKISIIFCLTVFSWIGWILGAPAGIMAGYLASFAGSLLGVLVGVWLNQRYL